MLTYFGHWPELAIPLPGTDAVFSLPFASREAAAGDHHSHCHGDSAGCANGSGGAGLVLVLLAPEIALGPAGGPLRRLAVRAWRPARSHLPAPEPGPPRTSPRPA